MTEPGGTDPNASGWSDAGSQGSWGTPPPEAGQPAQPAWGAPPPPPGFGDSSPYGNPPGYGTPQGWGTPPGYGAAPGYGPPPYGGYYGAPQTEGKAIGALICAIGAWVVCPLVLAVIALILASQSSRDIRNSGGRLGGEGMNTAARVIAWINIALAGLFLLFVFAGAIASTSSA